MLKTALIQKILELDGSLDSEALSKMDMEDLLVLHFDLKSQLETH